MAIEPYRPRPTRCLGLAAHGDWRIKLYGVCAHGEEAPAALLASARERVLAELPEPAVTAERYGAGFLIVHHGSGANWMLLDWWESDCILCQRLFRSPLDAHEAITEVSGGHLMACVYEMPVQQFEREAWVATVMRSGLEQGLPRYLEQWLET